MGSTAARAEGDLHALALGGLHDFERFSRPIQKRLCHNADPVSIPCHTRTRSIMIVRRLRRRLGWTHLESPQVLQPSP